MLRKAQAAMLKVPCQGQGQAWHCRNILQILVGFKENTLSHAVFLLLVFPFEIRFMAAIAPLSIQPQIVDVVIRHSQSILHSSGMHAPC